MEKLVKGDVVVLPFPFSNLTDYKRRPALIVASLEGDDIVLCQITSQARIDNYSVVLTDNDFRIGKLDLVSNIRPNKLFTADKSIIIYKIGTLKESKIKEVQTIIINLLRR